MNTVKSADTIFNFVTNYICFDNLWTIQAN